MRVLIGCEESQVVCKAFRDQGHNAYSCDILPTRGNPDWHYQLDIIRAIRRRGYGWWDLIILHPDCTALSLSGNRWYGVGMPCHDQRVSSVLWTKSLWVIATTYCRRVALENPTSVIFKELKKINGADVQYIQPWMFGHMEQKKTGLALHGVEPLKETNNVYEEMMKLTPQERERIFRMPPGPNRKRDRSVAFQGIADAMADQWGKP